MSRIIFKDYYYKALDNYDKTIKIDDEDLKVYSKKKLKELYPDNDYPLIGETYNNKKRDRHKDIGRLELNEKRFNISLIGTHSKIIRKQKYFVKTTEHELIAILKIRLLPFILVSLIFIGGIFMAIFGNSLKYTQSTDPDIKKIATEILTISGCVKKENKNINGAKLSLKSGNTELANATTDKDGNYLISDVKNGNYNLVCSYEDSVLTKIATVDGMSIIVDFTFPSNDLHDVEKITKHHNKKDLPKINKPDENTKVKSIVKIGEDTPPVAVGGLDNEALLHTEVGKEVDLTFIAKELNQNDISKSDKTAVTSISGELELSFFDFGILKEIFENGKKLSEENLKSTKTVLEVAVPYDSSHSVGTYVFRTINGKAEKFRELSEKPTKDFKDGTFYVTADTVYIYLNRLGIFAVGSANVENTVRGSDTITYSDKATVNLKTKKIKMQYKHDNDSTNSAKVRLYIVGENGNLLISESGTIPSGYEITKMTLKSGIKNMPGIGTYNGLMKIIYLGTDGNTATNVDIPLSIAITQ